MDMQVKGFTVTWPEDVEAPEATLRAAATLAVDSLISLTAGRVGGVPITVMPRNCHNYRRVNPLVGVGYPFVPYLGADGGIYNCACGSGCSCPSQPSVTLLAPVGDIISVTVDGTTVDPQSYHVEDGNRLVRTDGGTWPTCAGQNFTVTYLNAYPADVVANTAATVLAKEFLKALYGDTKCRLPSNVTNLSRQGVTMQMEPGVFPGGRTGIREVDVFILMWNPNNLTVPPTVHSPDVRRQNRQITWRP